MSSKTPKKTPLSCTVDEATLKRFHTMRITLLDKMFSGIGEVSSSWLLNFLIKNGLDLLEEEHGVVEGKVIKNSARAKDEKQSPTKELLPKKPAIPVNAMFVGEGAERKITCLICAAVVKNIRPHLWNIHQCRPKTYKEHFQIPTEINLEKIKQESKVIAPRKKTSQKPV